MNKLGIFTNFWENSWDFDHKKYIDKVILIVLTSLAETTKAN